jgi:tetratricopeptide (TPR) repeat protein
VHLLLQGDLAFPAWYHEGFAELLSTTTIREDLATLGGVPLERRRALEGGPRVRIEELLGARYSLDLGRRTPGFYAESWLLAHYLHVGPAYGAPRRLQQARDLLLLQNRGIGWQPAFERAFTGISIDGLQRELDLHRRRILEGSDLPVIDLALASLPKRFEESKLPTESAALRLGGLALRLGPTFVRVAEALFQTALGLAPGDPAALVGLARCAAQHGDFEAAEAKLELALRAGRDTGLIELARGEILMERYGRSLQVEEGSGPDPALPMEARSALLHATELLPSLPAAWAALGANYAADPSSDPTPGIHALERARESVGAHPGVELQLGTLYARKGETERARLLLSRVAVLALDDELAGKAQLELERLSPR